MAPVVMVAVMVIRLRLRRSSRADRERNQDGDHQCSKHGEPLSKYRS